MNKEIRLKKGYFSLTEVAKEIAGNYRHLWLMVEAGLLPKPTRHYNNSTRCYYSSADIEKIKGLLNTQSGKVA